MSDMISFFCASDLKEVKRKLEEIKAIHVSHNPNQEVTVEILSPKLENVVFNKQSIEFTYSVIIKHYEDDEVISN